MNRTDVVPVLSTKHGDARALVSAGQAGLRAARIDRAPPRARPRIRRRVRIVQARGRRPPGPGQLHRGLRRVRERAGASRLLRHRRRRRPPRLAPQRRGSHAAGVLAGYPRTAAHGGLVPLPHRRRHRRGEGEERSRSRGARGAQRGGLDEPRVHAGLRRRRHQVRRDARVAAQCGAQGCPRGRGPDPRHPHLRRGQLRQADGARRAGDVPGGQMAPGRGDVGGCRGRRGVPRRAGV